MIASRTHAGLVAPTISDETIMGCGGPWSWSVTPPHAQPMYFGGIKQHPSVPGVSQSKPRGQLRSTSISSAGPCKPSGLRGMLYSAQHYHAVGASAWLRFA